MDLALFALAGFVAQLIDGALGAYLLTSVPAEAITPWISVYLAVMGARIL
ncbi:MAG TPA: hypothetical protein VNJ02_11560 [Vicinamibacterales bacterium]|nr:hypothetical protein [Vicinamibacterales bacterium]